LHLPPLSAHRRSVARRELLSDPLERRRRAHRMARPLLRYGTARGGCRAYNRLAPFPPSAGFEVGRKSILTSYVDINYRNAPYAKEAPDEALCPPVFVLLPESADRALRERDAFRVPHGGARKSGGRRGARGSLAVEAVPGAVGQPPDVGG